MERVVWYQLFMSEPTGCQAFSCHTHGSKELYHPLSYWSHGSVSYLVIGSEQQLLCIICLLCTNKSL